MAKKTHRKYNNHMLKNMKYSAITIACLLLIVFYIFMDGPSSPEIFTTNIDLKNKIINGTAQNDDKSSLPFDSLIERSQNWLSQNFNVWKLCQNLANPSARYIVLNSGLRKEEVATLLSKELNWDISEKKSFLAMEQKINKKNMEGYYNPGGYLMPAATEPADAYQRIMNKFNTEISSRYATATAEIINMDMALKIASIIEREAGGKQDMRLISGIIWNRIFKDMNLEMDATLQYAKGSNKNWWPKLSSKDKYIDSPYNTYQNKGLPPTPISNVSVAAIKAALNPRKTSCIFYLHDRRGNIHCSITYKEHLANIKKYYGK